MAPIPRYWYCETAGFSGDFKEAPDFLALRPEPSGGTAVLIDRSTGEVHGEAILMSALPFPRFRGFSDGKEVILPRASAEALEGLDTVLAPFVEKSHCLACSRKLYNRTTHLRVEIDGAKLYSFYVHSCGAFLDEYAPLSHGSRGTPLGSVPAHSSNPYSAASSGGHPGPAKPQIDT